MVEGLRKSFYLSSTPITFEQFDVFCDSTGHDRPITDSGRGQQPVVNVSVEDAVAYCNWLTKKMKKIHTSST